MRTRVVWLFIVVLTVALCEECSTPSSPTTGMEASVPAPIAAPPALRDPAPSPVAITAPFSGPAIVNFDSPSVDGGAQPVTVNVHAATRHGHFRSAAPPWNAPPPTRCRALRSCSFAVTVAAAPRLRRNRILAFGDSITTGDVVVTRDRRLAPGRRRRCLTRPCWLQLLRERYGDVATAVFNGGLSGERTAATSAARAARLCISSRTMPRLVVLLEGYNDLLYAEPAAGIAAVEQGVSVLAGEARGHGARVFIALLTPTKPGRRQHSTGDDRDGQRSTAGQVARGEGAFVIDTFTPLLADLNANIGSDGLHPTAARLPANCGGRVRGDSRRSRSPLTG